MYCDAPDCEGRATEDLLPQERIIVWRAVKELGLNCRALDLNLGARKGKENPWTSI